MTLPELVQETVRLLSPPDQQKVLDFARSLQGAGAAPPARKDRRGMFAHHGVNLSLEDFMEARREAWKNFPRPFPGEERS
jgi:hypothetical protein